MPTDKDPAFVGQMGTGQAVTEPHPPVQPPRRDDDDEDDGDHDDGYRGSGARGAGGVGNGPLWLAGAGALLGTLFAALSTSDFMQHLDRQVHAIHCSFIPGAGKEIAESGCRTVMMSPYSSFFRESLWGGIPVSLWALAVFAFLLYRTALLLWRGNASSEESRFLLAATLLPVLMSVIYGFLSVSKLETTCKICVGIYVSSAMCFVGALLAYRARPRATEPLGSRSFVSGVAEGVAFVGILTFAYLIFVPRPDAKTSMLGCSSLVRAEDSAGVMFPLPSGRGGTPSIEVLDPLCPSCKAFDARLSASALRNRLELKGVLFPLDPTCNWMVTEALHPGACAVSEAVLCAAGLNETEKNGEAANDVLQWAFSQQADLRALAAKDEKALRAKLEQAFPKVKGCLGGSLVKSKLTKSLRWAVANAIPVLTPQLFVGESRMCDEDTDMGLEYTLSRMLSPQAKAARAERKPDKAVAKPTPVPESTAPVKPAPAKAPKPAATQPAAEEGSSDSSESEPAPAEAEEGEQ